VKPRSDSRPESYSPIYDSVKVIDHIARGSNWDERLPIVKAVEIGSMCELKQLQAYNGTSLGFFKPHEILDFTVTSTSPNWDADRRAPDRIEPVLFEDPVKELEAAGLTVERVRPATQRPEAAQRPPAGVAYENAQIALEYGVADGSRRDAGAVQRADERRCRACRDTGKRIAFLLKLLKCADVGQAANAAGAEDEMCSSDRTHPLRGAGRVP
jgi:hypothetical protein